MKKYLLVLVPFCLIFLLSACDKTDELLDSEDAAPINISGKAVKGIIIDGRVQAYPIVNGVIDANPIASTTTGIDGTYVLDIAPAASTVDLGAAGQFTIGGDEGYSGALFIVVDADPNGGSKMKCDVPAGCGDADFGETIDLTFSLEAVVAEVEPGNAVSVALSPLTHMAAAAAKNGALGKDGIEAANKKVAALFGIEDIIGTLPIDITSSESVKGASTDVVKSSYLSAAVAVIAEDKYSGDISTVLEKLSKSYTEQGSELIQKESSDSLEVVSLAEITQATIDTINEDSTVADDVNLVAALTELSNLDDTADNATPDTGKTDTPITLTSQDVEDARAVVNAVRTWNNQLDTLETAANDFGDDLEMAMDASEIFFEGIGESLGVALEAMVDDYISAVKDGATGPFNLSNHDSNASGVIEINTTNRTVSITDGTLTTNTDSSISSVVNTINLSITMPEESGNELSVTFSENGSVENSEAKISIKKGTGTLYFESVQTDIYADETELDTPSGIDLNLNGRIEELASSTRTNPIYFEGTVLIDGIRGLIETEETVVHNEGSQYEYTTTDTDFDVLKLKFSEITLNGICGNANGEKISGKFTSNMSNASSWTPSTAEIENMPEVGSIKAGLASYHFSTDKNTMTVNTINGQEFKLRLVEFYNGPVKWYRIELSEVIGFADREDMMEIFNVQVGDFSSPTTLLDLLNNTTYYSFTYKSIRFFIVGHGEYRPVLAEGVSEFSAMGGSFSGELREEDPLLKFLGETSDNYRIVSSSAEFTADFLTEDADLPPAKMTLSSSRSGLLAGDLTLTAEYDNIKMILGITADLAKGANGIDTPSLIVIDNDTNARLTIYPDFTDDDDIVGKVVINGNGVGTIEATSSGAVVVFFIDGTFESINF